MRKITIEELKAMDSQEGLVLQGCGGDLSEWVDGINGMLTEEGILRGGSVFTDVYAFENNGSTNLLFSFGNTDIDVGKLAMWRLQTRSNFGGTWLSDYLPNYLGHTPGQQKDNVQKVDSPAQEKPKCPLIGADGNIFNLMGIASRTLRQNDMDDQAKEMRDRITASGSYDEALVIIMDYVEVVDEQGMGDGIEDDMGDDDMDMDEQHM